MNSARRTRTRIACLPCKNTAGSGGGSGDAGARGRPREESQRPGAQLRLAKEKLVRHKELKEKTAELVRARERALLHNESAVKMQEIRSGRIPRKSCASGWKK